MLGAGPGFPCQKCYEQKLECKRSSSHYLWVFARQSRAASNPLPPLVPQVRRTSHTASNAVAGPSRRSHSPPVGERLCPSRDSGYDVPGPAYELLVGGDSRYAGLDSVHAALFWRSELERSEAMIDASYRQRDFHHKMLNEALMHCMVPPPDEGLCAKHVKFTSPASPRGRVCFGKCRNKGKCHANLVEEEEPRGSPCERGRLRVGILRRCGGMVWPVANWSCLVLRGLEYYDYFYYYLIFTCRIVVASVIGSLLLCSAKECESWFR
jgi:hypothetical protein